MSVADEVLRTAGRHVRPLHGVLGWWAATSFGLVSVLLAGLGLLFPAVVRALGPTALAAWLLFAALGRLGGTQLLRARYGGPAMPAAGAALVGLAGAGLAAGRPGLEAGVAAAVASLACGIAGAGDAAAAGRYPSLPRSCLRLRAAGGLVAASAIAAAPPAGLVVAAGCAGLAELALAGRLLPEVERLAAMLERTEEDEQDPRFVPWSAVD